jgi:FixJ family two-component response regulator
MPGTIDGYGLAQTVRELFPQAAIVVISGVVSASRDEMPANATFLAKPVAPERLIAAIKAALSEA